MDLVPSKHAIASMEARDITWPQVVETVTDPSVTYGTRGDQMFQRGDVAVVTTRPMTDGSRLVKTVLLRETEQWTNEDARARPRRPVVRQSTRPRPTSAPVPVQAPAFVPGPEPKPAPPRPGKHLVH